MCLPYKFLKEFVSNYSSLVLILTGIYCTMKAIKLQFTNVVFEDKQINNNLQIITLIGICILTSINGLIEFILIICIRTKYISSKDRLKLLLKLNLQFSIIILIACIILGIYNETELVHSQNEDYQKIYNYGENQLNDSVINYQFMTNPQDTQVKDQKLMMYFSYLEMNYFCGGWRNENSKQQEDKPQKFSIKGQKTVMNCFDAHLIYLNYKLDSTIIICLILLVIFLITLQLKCCLKFHKSNIKNKKQINYQFN